MDPPTPPTAQMGMLPDETMLRIFRSLHLPLYELAGVKGVCRNWRRLWQDESLAKQHLRAGPKRYEGHTTSPPRILYPERPRPKKMMKEGDPGPWFTLLKRLEEISNDRAFVTSWLYVDFCTPSGGMACPFCHDIGDILIHRDSGTVRCNNCDLCVALASQCPGCGTRIFDRYASVCRPCCARGWCLSCNRSTHPMDELIYTDSTSCTNICKGDCESHDTSTKPSALKRQRLK